MTGRLIELVAGAYSECSLQDGDVFILRMPVRRNLLAIRHFDANYVRPWFCWIARYYSDLRLRGACKLRSRCSLDEALRQRPPFQVIGTHHDVLLGRAGG